MQVKSDGGSTSYYELPEGASELQDLIEHKEMNFAVGNMFKACYRLGQKQGGDAEYDLKKIIWFAERELARMQSSVKSNTCQTCKGEGEVEDPVCIGSVRRGEAAVAIETCPDCKGTGEMSVNGASDDE